MNYKCVRNQILIPSTVEILHFLFKHFLSSIFVNFLKKLNLNSESIKVRF